MEFYSSRYDEAQESYASALTIYRRHGDQKGTATTLAKFGNLAMDRGQQTEALDLYQQSLAILERLNNPLETASNLPNLANALREQGRLQESIARYRAAVDIFKTFDARRDLGVNLGNLGIAYDDLGDHASACAHYREALDLHRELGNRRGEAMTLGNLGQAAHAQTLYEQAESHHREALELHRETSSQRAECAALGNLGETLLERGRTTEARHTLLRCLQLGDTIQPQISAVFRGVLALLCVAEGQTDEALRLIEKAEPCIQSLIPEYARFLCRKSQVLLAAGRPESARQALARAKELAQELGVADTSVLTAEIRKTEALSRNAADGDPLLVRPGDPTRS